MTEKGTLKQKILDALIIKKLPDDVFISTMTVCCELDIEFNVDNIARYIDLKSDGIKDISYGRDGDPATNRSLVPKKKKKKKVKSKAKKKQKREFHNQISLNVMIESKKEKPVNIKLFTNGSIQMTGCKSVENVIDVLSKIFIELQTVKAVIDKETMTIVEKPFINDASKLSLEFVQNITIGMINSNFVYPNKIDRLKLFNLLNTEQKECRYDPSNHAPVNIKYNCKDKSISIFVFEKGSILITGAKNCEHILEGYEFINKYLLTNHKKIVKSNINMTNIDSLLDNKIKIKNVDKYKKQQNFNSNKSESEDESEDEIEQAFKLLVKS
jgi:TATA-box binding protein (TBP) (component of TFIID and TFIIIB)